MASSLAKEAENISTADTERTCPNGRNKEDECSSTEKSGARTKDGPTKKESLCNGGK